MLRQALTDSAGHFRCHLLSLISTLGDFDAYFPLLKAELLGESEESRYWAANLLGRVYEPDRTWPDYAMVTLEDRETGKYLTDNSANIQKRLSAQSTNTVKNAEGWQKMVK